MRHDKAKKCSIDVLQVEIVAGLTCFPFYAWLNTVTLKANEKSSARGARTHHLPNCRQTRYTPDHTATVGPLLKYDNIELP